MKKQDRGAVLTSVILMVLVLTLIGVPLLGMVVFNYQLREMDNALRRSEYETEIIMDQIYLEIRNTVIAAIEYAKTKATNSVDVASKAQMNKYGELEATYDALWDSVMIERDINDDNYNSKINLVLEEKDENGDLKDVLKLGNPLEKTLNDIKGADTVAEGKAVYVSDRINVGLNYVSDDAELMGILQNSPSGRVLVDSATGMVDESALKDAYNMVFEYHYHNFIRENVENRFNEDNINYHDLLAMTIDKIMVNIEDKPGYDPDEINYGEGSYLKIDSDVPAEEYVDEPGKIYVDVSIKFRKSARVFPAGLSARFVIGTPEMETVTSVDQYSVPLSNPMTSRGMVVGGTIKLAESTTFNAESDITVMTYNEAGLEGEDVEDGIVLNSGSHFNAKSGVSVNGDIRMIGGCDFTSGSKELYYQNLYVGDIDNTDTDRTLYNITFGGNVVAKDDLEINTEGEVVVKQKDNFGKSDNLNYYGYNDTNDRGPDSSSSIVVNSKKVDNKTLQFGNLYLAGRAFIDGAIKVVDPADREYIADKDGEYILSDGKYVFAIPEERVGKETFKIKDIIYKTGESIAVKGNYIAYQAGFDQVDTAYDDYRPEKVNFSKYFMERTGSADKQYVQIELADGFRDGRNFDLEKHKYFELYAQAFADSINKIEVDAKIKYMLGIGFDKKGDIVPQTKNVDDSFIVNWGNKYDKYTQYFGYAVPEGEETARTRIFGTDGWIDLSKMSNRVETYDVRQDDGSIEKYQLIYDRDIYDRDRDTEKMSLKVSTDTENNDEYVLIYNNGEDPPKTLKLSKNSEGKPLVKGIIIVKDNLEITITDDVEFAGMIIVGGNLTITGGGTLTVKDGKNDVVNMIIGSYFAGVEGDLAGDVGGTLGGVVADKVENKLFDIFEYDDSETAYVVTKVAEDSFVDANELINITNWKKQDSGRL